MPFVGLLALIALGGVTVWFAGHVYQEVKASGGFALTPKGIRGTAQRARTTARASRPAARRVVRQTPQTIQQAPQKVRHIFAGAVATDWVAKRAHNRVNGKPPRRPLLERLTVRGAAPASQRAAVNGNGAQPRAATHAPATPAAAPQPRPAPTTTAPGRTQPAMPTTTTSTSGGGAAGDLMSAVTGITAHARAGGMRSKGTAFHAFHEGFSQQAAGLEQFARDLQENSQYGPEVWEPAMQAAAHLRAAGAQMGEGASALSALARTPMGEVATSSVNAPKREEINTA